MRCSVVFLSKPVDVLLLGCGSGIQEDGRTAEDSASNGELYGE